LGLLARGQKKFGVFEKYYLHMKIIIYIIYIWKLLFTIIGTARKGAEGVQ
jgi:hypothetical protein